MVATYPATALKGELHQKGNAALVNHTPLGPFRLGHLIYDDSYTFNTATSFTLTQVDTARPATRARGGQTFARYLRRSIHRAT